MLKSLISLALVLLLTSCSQGIMGGNLEKNLEETDILNMSGMRYNSLFNSVIAINIVGNLKINVGQTIFVDYPKNEMSKNPDVANQHGGKYLVLDLCHSFDGSSTITSLNLVRESSKRDPSKKA